MPSVADMLLLGDPPHLSDVVVWVNLGINAKLGDFDTAAPAINHGDKIGAFGWFYFVDDPARNQAVAIDERIEQFALDFFLDPFVLAHSTQSLCSLLVAIQHQTDVFRPQAQSVARRL